MNLNPVNVAIIRNPLNWIIVFLMVAIAGLAISLITTPAPEKPT